VGTGRYIDGGNPQEAMMAQAKRKSAASKKDDAISLLTEDHAEVKKMFKEFEKMKEEEDNEDEKAELVARICEALTVHAQIEEEIFYPAVREALDEDAQDVMDEADVEHASAKDLIAQLEESEPGDDHYDAKVTVLGEMINHHVKEEEGQMFPQAKKAKVDMDALGAELMQRKEQLMAEGGSASEEEEGESASK
jgi:hemerythrin superfamily protein